MNFYEFYVFAEQAGSLTQRGEGRYRRGNVQVRVGDYDLELRARAEQEAAAPG